MQLKSGTDVEKNLTDINNQLDNMKKIPDLLVLPEVFNYRRMNNQTDHYSEAIEGKSIQFLMKVAKEMNQNSVELSALNIDAVVKLLDGRDPRKIIYVPNKIVNIVV